MESCCETLRFSQCHLSLLMIANGIRGTIADAEKKLCRALDGWLS